MTRIIALFLLLMAMSVAGAPAVTEAASGQPSPPQTVALPAQEDGRPGDTGEAWGEVVIWSLVGLGIFAAVGGALYYFKRQVGGFPENPSWVAPITIMPSKDFPDEGDFGDQSPSHHAPADH